MSPEQIDQVTAWLSQASQTPKSEELVPGWEPDPPLLSDETVTFGYGAESVTVRLKILPGEWYISELLPHLQEWAAALYRGRTLELFQQAHADPLAFLLDMFKSILGQPGATRLKVSFYEFAAATFSTQDTEITARFFAKLPPDQQMGSIRKLVATNHVNFTGAWAEMPLILRHEITLIFLTIIQITERKRQNLTRFMQQMSQESPGASPQSGGLPDTGPADSWPSPTETPATI